MTITLLFGVHAHQPVGNFAEVVDEAQLRCYGMFLRVLERYPAFRFSVHFSGWLLDELLQRYPEDMERLLLMTRRGQVEWFGAGDCEPVLAAIPHRDRLSQISALSDKIERLTGTRPRGAWLTERVWESAVASSLVEAGIHYVAVDDYHFLCTGMEATRLDSFHTTEEDGRALDLFPISEQARYRLPFSPAPEAVAWLEELARQGQRAAIYFDDIEKLGIWPETYEWVYERGWLAAFIEGVLASPLIETSTYADFHAANRTRGTVYLPTTSYIEMNEWTLPAASARRYHDLLEAEKAGGRFERNKPFLRGGIWRNFLSRYAESNWMHKRMLELSARFAALPRSARSKEMQDALHRAQANDAYWHGLFGGLYLPHLRRAVWNNLLQLEARLDQLVGQPVRECVDRDHDGYEELFLRSADIQAVVRCDGDAAVIEFDSYRHRHNFGDTLRRYDEVYHNKLSQQGSAPTREQGIASAHDRVAFKHAIQPEDALPDRRPRASFVDAWVRGDGEAQAFDDYVMREGDEFVCTRGAGQILKKFRVDGSGLKAHYSVTDIAGQLEVRLNLAMPSCDGYTGRYVLEDGSIPCGFGQNLAQSDLRQLTLEDGVLGGALRLTLSTSCTLSARPHHTVSQSEAGFEKIMQAVEICLRWPLREQEDLSVVLEVL